MFAIELDNVRFSYRDTGYALHVSTGFHSGKITALVGSSGSGKSTLLQIINGLITPDQGTLRIHGVEVNFAKTLELRKSIGYVIQGAGLFPHLTMEENIGLSARINGEIASPARIMELMDMMNLAPALKKRYAYQLSGGEQQRASICMALYTSPKILLMDESLGSLDAITRKEIQRHLLQYHKRDHTTIVFVTHDISEALRLGEYVMVLDNGRVQQYGTRNEIITRPRNEFVRSLIESEVSDRGNDNQRDKST